MFTASAGKGDVFAILAHQDCNSFTTPRPTLQIGHCEYTRYKVVFPKI